MTSPAGGTCYGFAVEPVIPFAFVREGTGEPLRLEIGPSREPKEKGRLLRDWRVDGPEPFFAGLYATDDGYRLWADDSGWFEIDTVRARVSLPTGGNAVKLEERLWGIPALLCFAGRGDAPLHAASVDIGSGVILLAAPGRFGKTTMSAGFARAGYRLLSEDLSCVQIRDDCTVVPGPAMLRIRADVADRIEIPNAVVLDAGDARVHLALDPANRGDCQPRPVRGVVFLQGGADAVSLTPMDPSETLRNLFALMFRLPGTAETEHAFSSAAAIAGRVPAWILSYPYGLDVLDSVVHEVAARLSG